MTWTVLQVQGRGFWRFGPENNGVSKAKCVVTNWKIMLTAI